MQRLYKGFSSGIGEGLNNNIFRYRPRHPLDTPNPIHSMADEWFYDRFGVRARTSTLICTTSITQAASYVCTGCLAEIVPSTPFKLIYSESVSDFLSIAADISTIDAKEVALWLASKNYEVITSIEDLPEFYGEVMVDCASFYAKHIPSRD